MPKIKTKSGECDTQHLPKIILMKSENINIDRQEKSDEIRYYLTQIILLADKKGRPAKDQFQEVNDAA